MLKVHQKTKRDKTGSLVVPIHVLFQSLSGPGIRIVIKANPC